jgi:hypothetical protein
VAQVHHIVLMTMLVMVALAGEMVLEEKVLGETCSSEIISGEMVPNVGLLGIGAVALTVGIVIHHLAISHLYLLNLRAATPRDFHEELMRCSATSVNTVERAVLVLVFRLRRIWGEKGVEEEGMETGFRGIGIEGKTLIGGRWINGMVVGAEGSMNERGTAEIVGERDSWKMFCQVSFLVVEMGEKGAAGEFEVA